MATSIEQDSDVQFQYLWILSDEPKDHMSQQCLNWWRDQRPERHASCRIVVIAGNTKCRFDVSKLALMFNRDFHQILHDLCRFSQEDNKQTMPCMTRVKILTDFQVSDTECICEPRCSFWQDVENTPEIRRDKGKVILRAIGIIMANLAKQWFSSSLSSTSFTATLTDSLGEPGSSPGTIPMQSHRCAQKYDPVGDLVGRCGTPPLPKGIPDSNSDKVGNSNSDLVTQGNYSSNGMVKDSIGNDMETYTDGMVGNYSGDPMMVDNPGLNRIHDVHLSENDNHDNHLSENEHSHHLSENDHNHLLGAPARTKLPINRQTPDQPCEKHSPGDIGIHLSENESHDIHLSENSHDIHLSENSHDIHLSENETHSIHLSENGHSNHLNRIDGSNVDPQSAFPTASKLRAKQLRKEGYEPTKRRKAVEAHFDDLGDDITGLGGDLPYLFADYLPEYADSESDTDGESEVFIANWLRTSRKWQKCESIDADGKSHIRPCGKPPQERGRRSRRVRIEWWCRSPHSHSYSTTA